jgi:4-hydroxy-4-methyl-2-oxoglutarate aldolase
MDGEEARVQGLSEELCALGPATLSESGASPVPAGLRPVWPHAKVAAPAFPIVCGRSDNLALHAAVAAAPGGSVLVADASADPTRGYWGEVLTTGAEQRGLKGLIIAGTVRDAEEIEVHRFPVFAAGLALRGATKASGGIMGEPIVLGGVRIAQGDWVVAGTDGVCVIPPHQLESCLGKARARVSNENELFAKLKGGATTVSLLDLDASQVEGYPSGASACPP